MSGDAAAGTLVEIKVKQLERSGKKLSDEERKNCSIRRRKHTKSRLTHVMAPRGFGSTRLSIRWKRGRPSRSAGSGVAESGRGGV